MEQTTIGKIVDWLYQQKDYSDVSLNDDVLGFSFEKFNFVCTVDEDDNPQYLQLTLPYITKSENVTDTLINKAMELNGIYRVGKFQLIDGAMWLSAEILLENNSQIDIIFSRLIKILTIMGQEYKTFRKEKEVLSTESQNEVVPAS